MNSFEEGEDDGDQIASNKVFQSPHHNINGKEVIRVSSRTYWSNLQGSIGVRMDQHAISEL